MLHVIDEVVKSVHAGDLQLMQKHKSTDTTPNDGTTADTGRPSRDVTLAAELNV